MMIGVTPEQFLEKIAEKDKEIDGLLKQFRTHKDLNRKLANGNHDLSLKLKEAREVIEVAFTFMNNGCTGYIVIKKFLKDNPE